ncbi:MAG: hypothetical protein IIC12_01300 [Proteobacteria bacterium]|nr:hypothetical protein [Pseudomonadota bacterium]
MAVTVRVPAAIAGFLNAETPDAWLDEASGRLSELLLDLLEQLFLHHLLLVS